MNGTARTLHASAYGMVPYREALGIQAALVDAYEPGSDADRLLFMEHPSVLTMGRGGHADSIRVDRATLERLGIELFEVPRGGDVTWHGPGQLVGYTICDLAARGRDLHAFLRGLEHALQNTLKRFGIDAHPSTGRTGVWVGERKIASIGIAVRRWVSYHGFALNVCSDLRSFDLIHPCGLQGVRMTSMAEELAPRRPTLLEVSDAAAEEVAAALGYGRVLWHSPYDGRALEELRSA